MAIELVEDLKVLLSLGHIFFVNMLLLHLLYQDTDIMSIIIYLAEL